ncbi:unnamed protein product [Didymodactylos carnosus]|uniref:Uncharacterized protein n=3 Tax=Didymodactylos carnosus TaxID=1234261 RepID=A0A813YWY1_9BILA|nr:unnamed protein product [Didymodactylos carnosus]CAF3674635.1 unnamed protein product [Didymodactylos carnosus]
MHPSRQSQQSQYNPNMMHHQSQPSPSPFHHHQSQPGTPQNMLLHSPSHFPQQQSSQFSPSASVQSASHHQLLLPGGTSSPQHQTSPKQESTASTTVKKSTKKKNNSGGLQQQKSVQSQIKPEPMSFDEQRITTDADEKLPDGMSDNTPIPEQKIRLDPILSVPPHVLEQIDEVINSVVQGAGNIPLCPFNEILPPSKAAKRQSSMTVQEQQPSTPTDWYTSPSPQQQQATFNIGTNQHQFLQQHSQQQQQQQQQRMFPQNVNDFTCTNVINATQSVGMMSNPTENVVAERITSILSHEQQQQKNTNLILHKNQLNQQIINTSTSTSLSDQTFSLEDLLERDSKDKSRSDWMVAEVQAHCRSNQQQSQQYSSLKTPSQSSSNSNSSCSLSQQQQQQPQVLSLAHAVHLLRQAITHPTYQSSPPPQLPGLCLPDTECLDSENILDQFEKYSKWLKQRREIITLRIKADETNLADIKKKRNILTKKHKQSMLTDEEEQEMPRLAQQQTEFSRTLTTMRKERKQFDELEQAFSIYKQSRFKPLFGSNSNKSSPNESTDTNSVVKLLSIDRQMSNPSSVFVKQEQLSQQSLYQQQSQSRFLNESNEHEKNSRTQELFSNEEPDDYDGMNHSPHHNLTRYGTVNREQKSLGSFPVLHGTGSTSYFSSTTIAASSSDKKPSQPRKKKSPLSQPTFKSPNNQQQPLIDHLLSSCSSGEDFKSCTTPSPSILNDFQPCLSPLPLPNLDEHQSLSTTIEETTMARTPLTQSMSSTINDFFNPPSEKQETLEPAEEDNNNFDDEEDDTREQRELHNNDNVTLEQETTENLLEH